MQRPILSASFRLANKPLIIPRARLFEDRLELSGWTFGGKYRLVISLSEVARVEWWSGNDNVNLAIFLKDAEPLELSIGGAGNWKFAIDERLGSKPPFRAPLPDERAEPEKRSAAA